MAAPMVYRRVLGSSMLQAGSILQVLMTMPVCRRHAQYLVSHLQHKRTMSVFSFWKERHTEWQQHRLKIKNALIEKRVEYWGTELAAAHWLIYHNNAAIQFTNGDWYMKNRKGQYYLPREKVKGEYIVAIDATASLITYDGLDNIICLKHLKFLSLKESPHIDDFCLAKLYHFADTLTHLNISGCPQISERGLATLHHLRNLERLNMKNLPKVENPELAALMLEDVLPRLKLGVISAHMERHYQNMEKFRAQEEAQRTSTEKDRTGQVKKQTKEHANDGSPLQKEMLLHETSNGRRSLESCTCLIWKQWAPFCIRPLFTTLKMGWYDLLRGITESNLCERFTFHGRLVGL
ncbi:distal membrane-arm assembly complex protein 2-like [Ptychodera flava]|uniref:distal membrane-arm assembly complex protein 2-like n=1 Tax=Ptychodera flava TaxID=63121 RepID=UPI003969D594